MQALVSHLHGAVADVHIASEVESVVQRLVSATEAAQHQERRQHLKTAIAVARRHMQLLVEREEAAQVCVRERARSAAALRSALTAEVGRVASQLRLKAKLESELVATRASVNDAQSTIEALRTTVTQLRGDLKRAETERDRLHARVSTTTTTGSGARPRPGVAIAFFFSLRQPALMRLLQFLQPRDVVSLAATNHAMYSRVDALFSPRRQQHRQSTGSPRSLALGISGGVPPGGGGAAGAGAGVGPHASGVSGSGAPSGSLGRAGLGRAGLGRAGGGTRGGNSGSMNNNRSPRQPGHPSEQIPDHPSGSSSSGGRGRGAEQGTASRRGSRLSLSMGRSGKNSSRKPLQMKDVLAALESNKQQLMAVHADNEDTKQRLAAAVRVRGFLVTRLAEVEAEVKAAKEDKERVLAQAASDREVMTFLDDRVRELEDAARASAAEINKLKQHVADVREKHRGKTKMLEGLVRMGTAQRQDAEVQFKAQKKLLVKEIKSLRLAVATLQAERAKHQA